MDNSDYSISNPAETEKSDDEDSSANMDCKELGSDNQVPGEWLMIIFDDENVLIHQAHLIFRRWTVWTMFAENSRRNILQSIFGSFEQRWDQSNMCHL